MTTDPRVEAVSLSPDITEPVRRHLTGGDVKRFLAAADAVDPLRAFLANPGVGQVEELAWTYEEANTRASREGANVAEAIEAGVCAVLAALADEFA